MKTKKRKTKVQMRRAIARDVIKQLGARQLVAEHMTYTGNLMVDAERDGCELGESLQPYLLRKKRKPCHVCALGAALVSIVRLENELNVGQYFDIHVRVGRYFTRKQYELIEQLFEGFGTYTLSGISPKDRLRFLWSFVAKNPTFRPMELVAAARRFANKYHKNE